MNPGDLLLKLAFLAAMVSGAFFVGSLRADRPSRIGSMIFGAHAILLGAAMGLLAYLFLAHQFQYAYVAEYSSTSLSPALSLAASWAGQEGSILLWVALGALMGLALIRQPGTLSGTAMFFVCLNQLALLFLLMVRSPFRMNDVIPIDGRGLNPMLENPWMIVHPPVLFIGFAALMIPAALAAAALVRNAYREWGRVVWPWVLFAVVTLGAGIVLGGVWAYMVLGWGGYWAWDPVENASLIPWLIASALIHGLLIMRASGAAVRISLALALAGWVAVLGGTYLTRSGVLQDFSVHSFTDMGLNTPLTTFLLGAAALSALLLILRWNSIRHTRMNWARPSREAGLWFGMVTLIVLTVLVAIGTSAPLITSAMGEPASVQSGFYKTIILPLGLALLLFLGVTPALRWSRQETHRWRAILAPGAITCAVALIVALAIGLRDLWSIALVAAAGLAFGVQLVASVRQFGKGWKHGAGSLGHVGLAVMAIGIIISSSLGEKEQVRLPQGEEVSTTLGYALTFDGIESGPRGEYIMKIRVQDDDWTLEARPWMLESEMLGGYLNTPAISGWRGIYLSPLDIETHKDHDAIGTWLARGEEIEVRGVGYKFSGFRVESHEDMLVYADIEVSRDGNSYHLSPGVRASAQGNQAIPAFVPGLGQLLLQQIDADRGRVALILPDADRVVHASQVAIVELSTKPLINLVWIGAMLTLLASALAGVGRAVDRIGGRAARRGRVKHART